MKWCESILISNFGHDHKFCQKLVYVRSVKKIMKRLVFCCDGTGQDLAKDYPLNVVKITQASKPIDDLGTEQVIWQRS